MDTRAREQAPHGQGLGWPRRGLKSGVRRGLLHGLRFSLQRADPRHGPQICEPVTMPGASDGTGEDPAISELFLERILALSCGFNGRF